MWENMLSPTGFSDENTPDHSHDDDDTAALCGGVEY